MNVAVIYSFPIFQLLLSQVYEWPICCAQIKSKKANLRRYILIHGPLVDKYKCDLCGVTYSNSENFKKHCDRFHPAENIMTATYIQQNAKRKRIRDTNSNGLITVPLQTFDYQIYWNHQNRQFQNLMVLLYNFCSLVLCSSVTIWQHEVEQNQQIKTYWNRFSCQSS